MYCTEESVLKKRFKVAYIYNYYLLSIQLIMENTEGITLNDIFFGNIKMDTPIGTSLSTPD